MVRESLETRPRDLVAGRSVRARVGYGGGDFSVAGDQVFFVSEGRIFRHGLEETESVAVTPPWGQASSSAVSPDGRRLVYVHSAEGVDCLGLASSDGSGWPVQIASGRDFYMQPAWHPDGRRIAWIAWDHPNMPWDGSGLYLGEVGPGSSAAGAPYPVLLAGDPAGSVAVFQPAFSPDGRYLSFVTDREGWFNLWLHDLEEGSLQPLVQDRAEYAGPAWIQGLRTHAWTPSGDAVYAIRLDRGLATLVRVGLEEKRSRPVGGALSCYTALGQYRFEIPFLTSRGFAVLDLNYRGSSGYGRGHRDALKGRWGVADVEDTRFAAEFLVSSGRADPDRLVVLGGSAGGLTVLLSLIRHPGLFRAGVCLYGVSDLLALARETHKFEAHYLDSLVGVLPRDEALYRERSPLGQAGSIRDPVALFQGEDDKVVPPSQSDRIAEALAVQGIPHIYHRFPGEGHGWKKSRTIETYLEALRDFLAEHVA